MKMRPQCTAEYIHSDEITILTIHVENDRVILDFLHDPFIAPGTRYEGERTENEMLIRLLSKAKRLSFQNSV